MGTGLDHKNSMSRYGKVLVLAAILLALLVLPIWGCAQNASVNSSAENLTPGGSVLVNVSPVTKVSGSSSLSIRDAAEGEINYSAYGTIFGDSPHVSVITAQLFLEGKPYNRSDIPITFTSDNDTVAVLEPLNRTRPSDEHGQAKILLISNNTVGLVNITASSRISFSREIRDTCTVYVVGWGTVSGVVTDKNKNGVPYAKLTLWVWNGTDNVGILRSQDNPQLSNDGSTAAVGTYTFVYVPRGTYNLTAEKDGNVYFAMVYMNVGTYTANVAFPDYVFPGFIRPTAAPTATPTPVPTAAATEAPSPTPTPAPGPGWMTGAASVVAVVAWMAIDGKK